MKAQTPPSQSWTGSKINQLTTLKLSIGPGFDSWPLNSGSSAGRAIEKTNSQTARLRRRWVHSKRTNLKL